MKVVVIIPTYNEEENIGRLIPLLAEEFEKIPQHNCQILVIDSSADNTRQIVRNLMEKYPFVNLYEEKEKSGLGGAYLIGFKHAMGAMNADVVIEMDGDLQHDPKYIPEFIREIENGYDYVIGSRFMRGGSIPREWNLKRKFLSWGGSFFSRVVLGIFNIHDFTTGYKATRVQGLLDKIDLDGVLSKGFAYKIDLLYRKVKAGAKVKEIPIAFGLRDRGTSKMERGNFMDSLKVVLAIRFRESQSFFKFIAVGFAGLGTDTLLFNIFRVTILSSRYASAAAGFIAMIVTFTLNNIWSFKHNKITAFNKLLKKFIVYGATSYIPIIFRSWLVGFMTAKIADTSLIANIAFFIGVAVGLVWNYTIYSRIIWRKKYD